MPIHDWTKVDAGIFHHFHNGWITRISDGLNDGVLHSGYYALAEQGTRPFGPDVLTLQTNGKTGSGGVTRGSVAILDKPPKVRVTQKSEADLYAKKANRIAVRHSSDRPHLVQKLIDRV